MTQPEYEQKKRECWEEFCESDKPYDVEPAFAFAFDRAYALGKEKEAVTQEEIEKAAEEYSQSLGKNRDVSWHDAEYGFIAGANFTLGKQEKDADTVIQGWVARDLDGEVFLYENKPERGDGEWLGRISSEFDFQQLKWGSDPIEVELIIKRKKK